METRMSVATLSPASREDVSHRAAASRGEEQGVHVDFTLTRAGWRFGALRVIARACLGRPNERRAGRFVAS